VSEAWEQARESKQSLGGKARAAALTPEQRSESARKAVKARWARRRTQPEVTVTVVTGARLAASDARWPNETNTWRSDGCDQ